MSHLSSAIHSLGVCGCRVESFHGWKPASSWVCFTGEEWGLASTPELLVQSLSASRGNGQLFPPASRLLWLWLYTHCGLLNVSHRPTASLNPHNLIRCEQLLNGTLKQSNQAMLKTVRNTIYWQLWFKWQMPPKGSYIWTLGPELVLVFGEVTEPWGGRAFLAGGSTKLGAGFVDL